MYLGEYFSVCKISSNYATDFAELFLIRIGFELKWFIYIGMLFFWKKVVKLSIKLLIQHES